MEEVKNEVKEEVVKIDEIKEEIKLEVKEEVREVKAEEKEDNDSDSDIFVTENDTFDVSLKYYKKNGQIYTDSGADVDFSPIERSKEIRLTLKYPDQSDCNVISAATVKQDIEKLSMRDLMAIELTRIIVLMRKWSLNKELNRDNFMSLNAKIVKGLIVKIRENIGMEGIF
jgi:hypothetical protein